MARRQAKGSWTAVWLFVGLVVLLAVFYLAWRAASPPRRLAVNMGPPAPVRAPVPNGAPNPQPLPGPTPKPPS
jgi:hypothetical protein